MKKIYILSGLMCLLPGLSFGENPRIAELTRSKQEKMERLQKCEGTTKALKIAGLSTIGLTAVGVVGNVVEAQKLQTYQGQSNELDTQIAQTKKEIEDKKVEIEKKKAAAAAGSTEPTNPTETPTTSTTSTTTGLATVDTKIDGTSYLSRDFNDYCYDGITVASCGDLKKGQWKVEFEYGTVWGEASCNSNSGTHAVTRKMANELTATAGGDDDKYCWCKVTKFKSRDKTESDMTSSAWVFNGAYESAAVCAGLCPYVCDMDVGLFADFRKAVFAGAGN